MAFRCNAFLPRAVLAAAIAGALAPVHAQATAEQADSLDRVIVTAQKREQQVQDVPIAITAYSGEFLDRLNVDTFEQLGGYVPGLQTQVQSPNNPGFVIRGITSDSGEANVEPRVSLFQDGVSISRSRGAVVELFDIERVEVLRGPQGTLFGRGAQIGAIHVIQNKAVDESSGAARFGVGNHGETYASAHVNTPLVDDALYGRFALYHQSRDGSIDNLSGGDLNGRDTNAMRASFRADIGELSTLDLIFNYQKDTPPGTAFRSNVIPTRAGSTELFRSAADLNRGEELGLDRVVKGTTLLGNFVLNDDWSLATTTGLRDFDSVEQFDGDGSQVFLLEFAEDAEGRQFSQEFRFNYDAGGAFTGFVGASWFDEEGTQRVPFATDERSLYALLSPLLSQATGGQLPVVPVLNPDGTPNTNVPPGLPGLAPGLPAFIPLKPLHTEEYANFGSVQAVELFVDGTWAVNDRLDLTLGLRATREDVEAGYQADFDGLMSALGQFLPSFPTDVAFPNALFRPTQGRVDASDEFDSVVGRAVASYDFTDTLNGYVSASRGRRPDVINVTADGAEHVDAEIVWSYEAGLKGATDDGRFLYDVAVYYYDYENFQAQVQNPTPPPFFIATNAGNAHASGLELALMQRFTESMGAFFNYAYTDATFNATDDDGRPQELAGNRFRLTPEHSAAIGLDWEWDVGNASAVYVRPNYTWRSQVFFEDDNTPGIEQGSYGLLNLNVGVRMGNGWDVQLYAQNLADEEYLIDAGNTGSLFGIPTYVPGSPRFYGLRAGFTF